MRFPWQADPEIAELRGQVADLEKRAAGSAYTAAVIARIAEHVAGGDATPDGIAALEIAAGLWGRGFASADVAPSTVTSRAVNASILETIGRELVSNGECVFDIRVNGGAVSLLPAESWDVIGGPDPATWNYTLTLAGPSFSQTVYRTAAGVVHCRYAPDPSEPWRGIGPLAHASITGKLAALLDVKLQQEIGGPVGRVLPLPPGQVDGLIAALNGLTGNLVKVDTTESGQWDGAGGRGGGSNGDFMPRRIGANPPAELISLRSDVSTAVLSACGIPAELIIRADGAALRESWRQFLHGTVSPVADIVAAELAAKLDTPDLKLSFDRLFASDLSGRARAFQSLVGGGMDTDRAAALAGLMVSE